MGNASLTDQNEWAEWKMKKKAWIKKTAHVIRFVQKATWKKRHFFLSNKRISCFKTIYFVLGTCNAHILLAYCNMSIARLIDSRLKDSVPISVGKRKSWTTHTYIYTGLLIRIVDTASNFSYFIFVKAFENDNKYPTVYCYWRRRISLFPCKCDLWLKYFFIHLHCIRDWEKKRKWKKKEHITIWLAFGQSREHHAIVRRIQLYGLKSAMLFYAIPSEWREWKEFFS